MPFFCKRCTRNEKQIGGRRIGRLIGGRLTAVVRGHDDERVAVPGD